MTQSNSAHVFYFIDRDGHRRIPHKIQSRDGRYGYAIHPVGKGNDSSAAEYTEDERKLVEEVVLNGKGVRCRADGGPQDGQSNTVGLGHRAIRGYWVHVSKSDWVAGAATRPEAGISP